MKARDLLRAVESYSQMNPEEALQKLSDEQFRTMMLTVAEVFRTMKAEAIRRGIWDELKGTKVK